MANTYTKIYLHLIFAVQNRASLIQTDWKDELYKYITGIVRNNGHKLIAVNGMPNHIHIAVGYKPHQLIPELLQDIKGDSSKWINKNKFVKGRFSWQPGYGAFSFAHSQIDNIVKYIKNQEEHHRRKTFKDEYQYLLEKYDVMFNEKYILRDIQ